MTDKKDDIPDRDLIELIDDSYKTKSIDDAIIKSPPSQAELVKQRSTLPFLAFVISAASLIVSAYLYVQVQKQAASNQDFKSLEQTLNKKAQANGLKFSLFTKQIKKMKSTNAELLAQLTSIEKIAVSIKQNELNKQTGLSALSVDDTQLIAQMKQLNNQIKELNKDTTLLRTDLNRIKTDQAHSIKQLKIEMNAFNPGLEASKNNFFIDVAVSLLETAFIQLNIKGNVTKAKILIEQTQRHLRQMNEKPYTELANQLKSVNLNLIPDQQNNPMKLNSQIDAIILATNTLMTQQKQDALNKDDSAWYAKIIIIEKIEDNLQDTAVKNELQNTIYALINHLQILKIALMSGNQKLWNSEKDRALQLIQLKISDNANTRALMAQISALKSINIQPEFPDLKQYIKQLKAVELSSTAETE